MSKMILCIFLVHIAVTSLGQNKIGKISGIILDNENKHLEGVTITLLRQKDTSIAKTAISNKAGEYGIDKVSIGRYILRISAVGYGTYTSQPIEISEGEADYTNPNVNLVKAQKNLGEVIVNSRKPFIENQIDKMVVNVDASPTSTGLSALEILEKSPGITIDNDDNISVKGKQGVIILMDGKPAYLNGKDLANYLRNMPASQLDVIEIMTQPSAKYDASGNSGVINIKTKKNKANGFNATINSSAIFANYFKNTNSVNFNLRRNKINLFGNYGYASWVGFNEIEIKRQFRLNSKSAYTRSAEQESFGKFYGYPHNFKLGADYSASKNTTLGINISGLVDDRKFQSKGNSLIYDSLRNQVQNNQSSSSTHDPWSNLATNLNFRRVLGSKGAELTADADYVLFRTKGKQYSDNYLYNNDGTLAENPYLLKGYLPADIDIFSVKSDFTQSLPYEVKLEAGFKVSYVMTDNDAQYTRYNSGQAKWLIDTARSNHFIYKENINAAYLNFRKQMKKWGVQIGIRAEQTIAKGDQVVKNSSFSRNYLQVFPTTYISYKLNENNTLGLNYGRRIERPGYQDLNPFQYLLDRYTYRQGNPYLQPQFSNNIELSYNFKGQVNVSVNYNNTTDIINDIIKTEKDGSNYVTFQTKENIASRRNIGLAINYNKPLNKWWNTNIFFNGYNNYFEGMIGTEKISLNITAFNANISNQFNFGNGWTGELSGFYNSKNLVSSVILAKPMGMFSLGAGKQVLNKKGNIRLNVRDPFWLMKFRGNSELDQFSSAVQSKWDNRRYIISITYRIGKTLQQQQRKRSGGSEEEQNRINIQQQQ